MSRETRSRTERYEKIRQSTKKINRLILLSSALILLLIMFLIFGNNDDENIDLANDPEENLDERLEEDNNQEENQENGNQQEQVNETDENSADEQVSGEVGDEQTSETNDPNVKEVIVDSWAPYPTEQEEPHVIDLNENSQDRIEMEFAIAKAIGVERDQLTYWWLESGGVPDRIIATVEKKSDNGIFRVELQWITNEGWQPQRVEILFENDQLWRFENNQED